MEDTHSGRKICVTCRFEQTIVIQKLDYSQRTDQFGHGKLG